MVAPTSATPVQAIVRLHLPQQWIALVLEMPASGRGIVGLSIVGPTLVTVHVPLASSHCSGIAILEIRAPQGTVELHVIKQYT